MTIAAAKSGPAWPHMTRRNRSRGFRCSLVAFGVLVSVQMLSPLIFPTKLQNLAGAKETDATHGSTEITQSGQPSTRFPLKKLQRRVVSWHTIGGTSPDASRRMIGLGLKRLGWSGYVERYVVPQTRGGLRRILLHNPWGIVPDEPMSFDQYREAQEAGMLWLTRGFVEAWRPVIEGEYSDGEPVEVIAYLGAIDADAGLRAFLDDRDPPETTGWMRRVLESLEPALTAGMSVAFDSANDLPRDSPEFRAIQLVRSLGHRVYVEPRPIRAASHLHDLGVIATVKSWQRTDPDRYDVPHMARHTQLSGDVILLIRDVSDIEERRDLTRRWLADSPVNLAVPLRGEVSQRRTVDEWVNGESR